MFLLSYSILFRNKKKQHNTVLLYLFTLLTGSKVATLCFPLLYSECAACSRAHNVPKVNSTGGVG